MQAPMNLNEDSYFTLWAQSAKLKTLSLDHQAHPSLDRPFKDIRHNAANLR